MKACLLTILMIFLASPALAMKIANCSDETHELVIDYYHDQTTVTFEPGDSRYFFGRAKEIRSGDQTIMLVQYDNEYCIWKGGRVVLQRRNRRDQRGR